MHNIPTFKKKYLSFRYCYRTNVESGVVSFAVAVFQTERVAALGGCGERKKDAKRQQGQRSHGVFISNVPPVVNICLCEWPGGSGFGLFIFSKHFIKDSINVTREISYCHPSNAKPCRVSATEIKASVLSERNCYCHGAFFFACSAINAIQNTQPHTIPKIAASPTTGSFTKNIKQTNKI